MKRFVQMNVWEVKRRFFNQKTEADVKTEARLDSDETLLFRLIKSILFPV